MVRILGFHCHGPGFNLWLGNWVLQATQHGQKKKKKKNYHLMHNYYMPGAFHTVLLSDPTV